MSTKPTAIADLREGDVVVTGDDVQHVVARQFDNTVTYKGAFSIEYFEGTKLEVLQA